METLVKKFGWGGVVASEGLPNGTVGTRAAPHKTFQRATFQIGALSSIFYPRDKVFGVWLDFVLQVKCRKEGCFFVSLGKGPP